MEACCVRSGLTRGQRHCCTEARARRNRWATQCDRSPPPARRRPRAVICLPLLWAISTSLKPTPQVYTHPTAVDTEALVWSNYPDALTTFRSQVHPEHYEGRRAERRQCGNNQRIGGLRARLRWRYRDAFFFLCIATMMVLSGDHDPALHHFSKLRWINTYLP